MPYNWNEIELRNDGSKPTYVASDPACQDSKYSQSGNQLQLIAGECEGNEKSLIERDKMPVRRRQVNQMTTANAYDIVGPAESKPTKPIFAHGVELSLSQSHDLLANS